MLKKTKGQTILGTWHFKSREAAVSWYGDLESDAESVVERKLRDGEIHIGRPSVGVGEVAFLVDNGRRWAVSVPWKESVQVKPPRV